MGIPVIGLMGPGGLKQTLLGQSSLTLHSQKQASVAGQVALVSFCGKMGASMEKSVPVQLIGRYGGFGSVGNSMAKSKKEKFLIIAHVTK